MFERTQNRLVLILVNFACEWGQIITIYDFQIANYKWWSYQTERPLVLLLDAPGSKIVPFGNISVVSCMITQENLDRTFRGTLLFFT